MIAIIKTFTKIRKKKEKIVEFFIKILFNY